MLRSVLYNLDLLRKVFEAKTPDGKKIAELLGHKKKDKEKYQGIMKAIFSKARSGRSSRAAAILRPTVVFTRVCGSFATPYSHGAPLAEQLCKAVSAAVAKHDFVDNLKGETAETVSNRRVELNVRLSVLSFVLSTARPPGRL